MSIPKPTQLSEVDLSEIRSIIQAHLDDIHEDSDDPHYIYEAVMTAFYGCNVFKYINSQIDRIGVYHERFCSYRLR